MYTDNERQNSGSTCYARLLTSTADSDGLLENLYSTEIILNSP